jgi:simple sugar transport system ATP-binding protein
MDSYGMEVDLDKHIEELAVGEEQRVEILKVLYRDADIIIMDEPTAVLTPQETRRLFSTLRTLAQGGRTIIFITHKLEEVLEVADRVTVMRAGSVVGTLQTVETNISALAELMVGRKMDGLPEHGCDRGDEVLLEVDGVSLVSRKGRRILGEVSLTVHRAEIFGICGVDGNGQDELFEVLIGIESPTAGSIRFLGRDITRLSTARRLRAGLAHIPPDRIRMGLVGGMSLRDNLILGRHRDMRFSGHLFLKGEAITNSAKHLIEDFRIEPPAVEMDVGLLSGGNQQKVIAARELSREPDLLVASQPTRGLDIGAADMIHRLLVKQADAGKAVLLISADLAEVMKLADTIAVMYRGSIVDVMPRSVATEEKIGLLMAGARS